MFPLGGMVLIEETGPVTDIILEADYLVEECARRYKDSNRLTIESRKPGHFNLWRGDRNVHTTAVSGKVRFRRSRAR